ncbi:glycosyltransferase family 4 protein [Mucilaginibacter sp. CSA2-8R]|uniref:glycosyltransferase family 4 protein n=1 Tax=Mucilaginibacter sp. CSA2-8R TaxID=3141542 RepID=UPI00315D63D7
MAKILIISPVATHPQDAGHKSRIYSIAENLRQHKHEVAILVVSEINDAESAAMSNYWGNSLYQYIPYNFESFSFFQKASIKLKYFLFNSLKKKQKAEYDKTYTEEQNKHNHLIDDSYCFGLSVYLKQLQAKEAFDVVITEYVALSLALESFDHKVLKVLDTHDVFTDRYKMYLERNLPYDWWSFFRGEEAKGLNRADIIFAIQNQEKQQLQQITQKPVKLLGHIVPAKKLPAHGFGKIIVFVGVNNSVNVQGINHFIKEILPHIKASHPDVRLLLAGNIVKAKDEVLHDTNVEFTGIYNESHEPYLLADIVINPVIIGTGLKIKTIEAISFGLPLISFQSGVDGLPESDAHPYFIKCNSDAEFVSSLLEVMSDAGRRKQLSENARRFISQYNEEAASDLLDAVNKHMQK